VEGFRIALYRQTLPLLRKKRTYRLIISWELENYEAIYGT